MSIVLTLLCNNSTITIEVHSRIETQLYTFTFRNTFTHLDQQAETEFYTAAKELQYNVRRTSYNLHRGETRCF